MPKRQVLGPQRRTNLLIWCLAFVCAFIAIIVIIAGIVILAGYLEIHPKVPLLYVQAARLDKVLYDQASVLAVRLIIIVQAENHNMNAHVTFYGTKLMLGYHGRRIAVLVADPFEVKKNTTQELSYMVESSPIPLDKEEQTLTDHSMRTGLMPFFLKGNSRTRWKVGPLGSVKFWLHINCHMLLPTNNTVVHPHCSTKSH